MATVRHPSGSPTYVVDDPTPYLSVGWSAVDDLNDMTVKQLRALAKNRGIDLGEAKIKTDIIAAFSGGA